MKQNMSFTQVQKIEIVVHGNIQKEMLKCLRKIGWNKDYICFSIPADIDGVINFTKNGYLK